MRLYGEILNPPKLRFDFSSTYAEDIYSKRGLKRYGPYDSNLFPHDRIRCVVMFPSEYEKEKQILVEGLIKGEGSFEGFERFFKIHLDFVEEVSFNSQNVMFLVDKISADINPDIVYVILPKNSNLYREIKLRLLLNGIPSQVITAEKLSDSVGRQYTLENIALASYAKVGGTPWTISTQTDENNLVIGVSRAQDYLKRYLVGFVTLFTNDGDFLFMHSKAPVIEWDQYVNGLSELVVSAINEYRSIYGSPDSIVVHFHKRPGKKEIKAIENALHVAGEDIRYAIIHLNEYSNFRLFDTSHNTYIPPRGLKVNLSSHEVLLLVDGRIGDRRSGIGVPRVLNIRMDKRSTLSMDKFPNLVKQIYDFSYINWRGFNAKAIPVTLNYSKLIARMIIELGGQNWNEIIAEGKLRDKSWFL